MVILWPCLSSVTALSGDAKRRAIINTVFSLMSAAVISFPLSSAVNPTRKFQVVSHEIDFQFDIHERKVIFDRNT